MKLNLDDLAVTSFAAAETAEEERAPGPSAITDPRCCAFTYAWNCTKNITEQVGCESGGGAVC